MPARCHTQGPWSVRKASSSARTDARAEAGVGAGGRRREPRQDGGGEAPGGGGGGGGGRRGWLAGPRRGGADEEGTGADL